MKNNKNMTTSGLSIPPIHYKWKALFTVCMGGMMSTIDASITNIAFPTFTKVFNTEITTVMWVTIAYYLLCTSLMLVFGKIGDLLGRKRIYTLGAAVFTAGLLSCSLSQSIGQLIFFRIVQACGAAMTISCGVAIITEAFPDNERGKGLGIFGVFVSLGFITGPVMGGILLNWINWRAIFFTRAPIAFITFLLAFFLLKEEKREKGPVHLDYPGTIISSIGIFCFVYGVTIIKQYGLKSLSVNILIGLGMLLLAVFVLVEKRSKNPIVDITIFRNSQFSIAILSLFFHFMSQGSLILLLPFYLINAVGMTPSRAGFILAFQAVSAMIFGPISGWLSDRFQPPPFTTIASIIAILAFYDMLGFEHNTSQWTIAVGLAVMGAAVGAFQPPNNSTIMGGVSKNHLGTASALIATVRQVGTTVGIAIVGTLYSARIAFYTRDLILKGAPVDDAALGAIAPAFHDAITFSLILSAIVMILCLISWKISR